MSPTEKKIRIVLIVFMILLIPMGFLIKSLLAQQYDQAFGEIHTKPHLGKNDREIRVEALKKVEKAIQLESNKEIFYLHKAQILRELGEFNSGINTMNTILKKKPDFLYGVQYLALLYEDINKHDSAIENYKKALDLNNRKLSKKYDQSDILTSALLYSYLNHKDSSMFLLDKLLLKSKNKAEKETLYYCRNYIRHYKTGGIKDYLEGKTVKFMAKDTILFEDLRNDLLVKGINVDKLTSHKENNVKYNVVEVREIFRDDIMSLGYKEFLEKE